MSKIATVERLLLKGRSHAPHQRLQISRHRGKTAQPDKRDQEVRMTAINLSKQLYRPNLIYRSTGVTLTHLTYGEVQQSLFEEVKPHDDKLSHLVDELEAKFGKGIVKTGV